MIDSNYLLFPIFVFGFIMFIISLILGFAGIKYEREIQQRFPRLNLKINCILFGLMLLEWLAGIAIGVAIGETASHGGGLRMIEMLFICKYFISKRIINNDSDYGYVSNTILVYIITSAVLNVCGLILGGVLLWN